MLSQRSPAQDYTKMYGFHGWFISCDNYWLGGMLNPYSTTVVSVQTLWVSHTYSGKLYIYFLTGMVMVRMAEHSGMLIDEHVINIAFYLCVGTIRKRD